MNRCLRHIVVAFVILSAASCKHRPLLEPDDYVRVEVAVDVETLQNIKTDIYNEKVPVPEIDADVMRVLFFEHESGALAAESYISDVRTSSDGRKVVGGDLALRPGLYKLLIYNFGTQDTQIRENYSYDLMEGYTEQVSSSIQKSLSLRADDVTSIPYYQPDHLLVASDETQSIPYHTGIYTIEANAASVVETWYLQIKVEGLQWVTSAQAVLGGMVHSNIISRNERVEEPQTSVYMPLIKSDDKGTPVVCCVFNTFGHIENSHNPLSVTFNLKTVDGRTLQQSFDVSNLFYTENALKHKWLLLDETITVEAPEQIGGGGGFDPVVDDWEEENYDVII